MKSKTICICEICHRTYNSAESAHYCESLGVGTTYPVGLLNCDGPDGFHGIKLAFAVANCVVKGHYTYITLWACRDNGVGDSLGDSTCRGDSFVPHDFSLRWLTFPPMIRLIAWLESQNIKPLVWRDGEAVPLAAASAALADPPKAVQP